MKISAIILLLLMMQGMMPKTPLMDLDKDLSSRHVCDQYESGVMKFTCNLMHIDLTFYNNFIPIIWFQVSGFGCQESQTQSYILNTDTRNLAPKKRNQNSHASYITVCIRRHCLDRLRRSGLTVFGNPAPRDLGGNNIDIVSDRSGFQGARRASFC